MSRPTPHVPPAPGGRPGRDAARDVTSRGSVLIFVIGVLLLLAIVATAFLGSSRSDRTSTQQNAFNTQVDLLLDGVVHAAEGQITSDESVPGGTSYEPWDAAIAADPVTNTSNATNDNWLASRVPVTFDMNMPYAVSPFSNALNPLNGVSSGATLYAPGLNPAWWSAVSAPVLGSQFESPYQPTGYTGSPIYTAREHMVPTYVTFGGKTWPAFMVDTTPGTAGATKFQPFLAADADGDGVADSGFFRIPVGQLSGITYFGAVRIVDNNAAININTALSRDYDYYGNGGGDLAWTASATSNITPAPVVNFNLPAGSFPSNIGLAELLHSTIAAANNTSLPPGPTTTTTNMEKMTLAANTTLREFERLNHYRFALTNATVRPSGVAGIANTAADYYPYDDTPSGGSVMPSGTADNNGNVGARNDFEFSSVGEAMTAFSGVRPSVPGVSRFTGNTQGIRSPNFARNSLTDGINLASRFTLAGPSDSYIDTTTNDTAPGSLTEAISLSLTYGVAAPTAAQLPYIVPVRTQPYDGLTSSSGIDTWFGQNFNYLAELPSQPAATFMNRRSILTGINGVGDLITGPVPPPSTLTPPTPLPPAFAIPGTPATMLISSQATPTPGIPSGTDPKISINTARFEELFYGYFRVMARSDFPATDAEIGTEKGTPFSALYKKCQLAQGKTNYDTTVQQYSGDSDYTQSIYEYYNDPYIGMRFTSVPGAAPTFVDRADPVKVYDAPSGMMTGAAASPINGQTGVSEQNPLRMFRSVLRAPHDRSIAYNPSQAVSAFDPSRTAVTGKLGYWNDYTAHLPADQVLILRAAIAAANAEALRDSSHTPGTSVPPATNERIVAHQIPLLAKINNQTPLVKVVANVFGLRRQPYIVEVYANTNTAADVALGQPNPSGYFAIKLFNPYPYAISLRYCRLIGLRRFIDQQNAEIGGAPSTLSPPTYSKPPQPLLYSYTDEQYPNMAVRDLAALSADPSTIPATDQIDLGSAQITTNVAGTATYAPYIIPPNGVLILENYGANGAPTLNDDAHHRPQSSGLIGNAGSNGPVTPANVKTVNISYVPGLQRLCLDRELVLMRPTNCTPPTGNTPTTNFVEYIPPGGTAAAVNSVADMCPLDSFDFTGLNAPGAAVGPVRARAEIWAYKRGVEISANPNPTTNRWKWVYPGRYDGNQSITDPAVVGSTPRPRLQGVVQAVGTDGAPGIPAADAGNDRDPFIAVPPPQKITLNVDPTPAVPIVPAINIASYPDSFTIPLNCDNRPGDQLLRLSTDGPNLFPYGGFRRLGDLLEAPFIGAYTIHFDPAVAPAAPANSSTFLEVNPVTMDAALAEDTDPADNEHDISNPPADNATAARANSQSREQIGRFLPLRPTYGTAGLNRPDGTVSVNGDPAQPIHGADASNPSTNYLYPYSYSYDPNFDERAIAMAPGTPDPLRYNDDLTDAEMTAIDNRQLPLISGNPAQNARLVDPTRYQFARKLLEVFTFTSPHDDYLPNYPTQPKWQPSTVYSPGDTVQFGMNGYICSVGGTSGLDNTANTELDRGTPPNGSTKLIPPLATPSWTPLMRTPVANGNATAGSRSDVKSNNSTSTDYNTADDPNEINQSRPGLININTAPEKVLAAIPWATRLTKLAAGDYLSFNFNPPAGNPALVIVTYGSDGIDDNAQIAHMIALYRDGNYIVDTGGPVANSLNMLSNPGRTYGHSSQPFSSIYDLLNVPGFLDVQRVILQNAEPQIQDGDYSSGTFAASNGTAAAIAGSDRVRGDYKEQSLLLTRVSNLITTRSDVFTLYALVQGWRNAGTSNPQLVVQRRAAFIIDRSAITAGSTSGSMIITPVPVN